jgi:hypothetical protein
LLTWLGESEHKLRIGGKLLEVVAASPCVHPHLPAATNRLHVTCTQAQELQLPKMCLHIGPDDTLDVRSRQTMTVHPPVSVTPTMLGICVMNVRSVIGIILVSDILSLLLVCESHHNSVNVHLPRVLPRPA